MSVAFQISKYAIGQYVRVAQFNGVWRVVGIIGHGKYTYTVEQNARKIDVPEETLWPTDNFQCPICNASTIVHQYINGH